MVYFIVLTTTNLKESYSIISFNTSKQIVYGANHALNNWPQDDKDAS